MDLSVLRRRDGSSRSNNEPIQRTLYSTAMRKKRSSRKPSYPFRIREGIARALTVKDAGEAAYSELVNEFKSLPDSTDGAQHGFKWALGNAISIVATKKARTHVKRVLACHPPGGGPEGSQKGVDEVKNQKCSFLGQCRLAPNSVWRSNFIT
jgi:hypothetical protein